MKVSTPCSAEECKERITFDVPVTAFSGEAHDRALEREGWTNVVNERGKHEHYCPRHANEGPGADRLRLVRTIERIAEEAKRRALDPKNVEKGDHWRELPMEDLVAMFDDEAGELWQELMPPHFEPNGAGWECGDLLVVMAMMLDKLEGRLSS